MSRVHERERFPEAVRRHLAPLLSDHGLRLVSESSGAARFESETLGAVATFDPRGEVGLEVFRLGHEGPWERWTYDGMIGRASLGRVLEIAAERLQGEKAVLGADPAYVQRLGAENIRRSQEWTAYYAGKGPRPQTGKLP